MLQCPQCNRNSLGLNSAGQESCIYKDCRWTNVDNENVKTIALKSARKRKKRK